MLTRTLETTYITTSDNQTNPVIVLHNLDSQYRCSTVSSHDSRNVLISPHVSDPDCVYVLLLSTDLRVVYPGIDTTGAEAFSEARPSGT
jgi:hypothetical protein